MLNLPAEARIFSSTSSKSKLVAFEKRIGLMRGDDERPQVRARQPRAFSFSTIAVTRSSIGEHQPRPGRSRSLSALGSGVSRKSSMRAAPTGRPRR
jgi:hypothetical protein